MMSSVQPVQNVIEFTINPLPRIPWPVFIRIAAPGTECLDGRPLSSTKDVFAYGRSEDHAIDSVCELYGTRMLGWLLLEHLKHFDFNGIIEELTSLAA